MDSLKNSEWKYRYSTTSDNLFEDFYIKAFSKSCLYDRAVGYFSSGLLSAAVKGISAFQKNNGKMRLVIGHPLSEDEYFSVKNGITLKEVCDDLSDKLINILDNSEGVEKYQF